MTAIRIISVILLLCLVSGGECRSMAVVYVDSAAPGRVHNGKSWGTAYNTIGAAVKSLARGGSIWVKTGVYYERVVLPRNYYLYGGFTGSESSVEERLVGAFPTVIDAQYKGRGIDVARRARVIIDGITVQRGSAGRGAGIRCDNDSIVAIRNCSILDCMASQSGGGVYYGVYTTGEMSGCVVMRNKAPWGAGIVVEYHSYPKLERNVIARNCARVSGGGVYCPFHSGAYLKNCTVAFNNASTSGGGLYIYYGGPVTLERCIVAFNSAAMGGGAFGGARTSQASFTWCDFYLNAGGDWGGAIANKTGRFGNYSADPLFLMPDQDDFRLGVDSPCDGIGAFPLGP